MIAAIGDFLFISVCWLPLKGLFYRFHPSNVHLNISLAKGLWRFGNVISFSWTCSWPQTKGNKGYNEYINPQILTISLMNLQCLCVRYPSLIKAPFIACLTELFLLVERKFYHLYALSTFPKEEKKICGREGTGRKLTVSKTCILSLPVWVTSSLVLHWCIVLGLLYLIFNKNCRKQSIIELWENFFLKSYSVSQ